MDLTPKEKAAELWYKYYKLVKYPTPTWMSLSKECALIAVDEMLDDDVYDMSEELFEKRINYLEEVKQEIEKL